MAKDTKFFDALIRLINANISVLQMCRVVSYDAGSKTADVQPLHLKSSGSKRGLIQGALVLKHVEADISEGKAVAVVFADHDLDNASGAENFKVGSSRQHSVNDAVIVGVWDT